MGIGGSALQLILSYFRDHTQRVQIDGIYLILLVCCVGCHRAQFWDQ